MNNLKRFNDFLNESAQDDTYVVTFENPTFIKKDTSSFYDKIDDYDFDKLIELLIEDFNEAKLEQYIHDDDFLQNVISIRAEKSHGPTETFFVKVKVKGKPDNETLLKIRKYLSGQFSDGWGEGYEQHDYNDDGWYVSTWSSSDPQRIQYIKTEKED